MEFPTQIYVADVSPLHNTKIYNKWFNIVSDERRAKTLKYKKDVDRARSIAAEALLMLAYQDVINRFFREDALCVADGEILSIPPITIIEKGKPAFVGSEVHFNLSHSGDRVVCALSPMEVGCDVEIKSDNALQIAKRFFTKSEYEVISAIDNSEQINQLFTKVWTLKESVLKTSGVGLGHTLNDFDVIDTNGETVLSTRLNGDDAVYYLRSYEIGDGYSYGCSGLYDTFEPEAHIVTIS